MKKTKTKRAGESKLGRLVRFYAKMINDAWNMKDIHDWAFAMQTLLGTMAVMGFAIFGIFMWWILLQ